MASILLGVVVADWWLEIDLSRMSEIGPEGLKLAQETREDASAAISELEIALADVSARLDALERDAGAVVPSPTPTKPEVDQVSDATARLSRSPVEGRATVLEGRIGYIFIGNYDTASSTWTDPVLLRLDSAQAERAGPGEMLIGSQFRLRLNMVLRDGVPANDVEYFRSRQNLGVLPRGTLVTLLERPVGIDREFAVQHWAKVGVAE